MTKTPRILFFDIETKPVKAWIWRTGKQHVNHGSIVDGEKFDIICLAYKWADETKIHALTWDSCQNSAAMIQEFVSVLETADVVIGQNSDAFDIKQINTQRMLHKQKPIAWPTSEDTRKQIKKHFYVTSSSLEYMSRLLTGEGKSRMCFQDWVDIVDRKCPRALAKMVRYCKKDVEKLFQVWKRIQPYVTPRVSRAAIIEVRDGCPSCGSASVGSDGIRMAINRPYRRCFCKACGHRFKGKIKA